MKALLVAAGKYSPIQSVAFGEGIPAQVAVIGLPATMEAGVTVSVAVEGGGAGLTVTTMALVPSTLVDPLFANSLN
jgi:hypothetical protein